MIWRGQWCAVLLAVCCLRPLGTAADRIIFISPHSTLIRHEFSRAFAAWHQQHYGSAPAAEWRDVGGTTDALKFVQSEFAHKPAGIGIDLFFGGGVEPFLLLADKGLAEAYRPPAEVMQGIPADIHGVALYDPEYRWYGAALSAFGILQNTRVQNLCHLPLVNRWADLAQPELFGWVGAGDPRKSGSMNSMFEAYLQAYGWEIGWRILTCLGGNVRKFDQISTSTAKDVTLGETAYAFAIDFYGFTQIAIAGRTNMTLALPGDFTAVNPDGICLLKGAPNPAIARHFIDFILSESGQKLWFLPRGHPDGARTYSIERMTVRPDFYTRYKDISNIAYSPFRLEQSFRYDNQLARTRRDVVAGLIGALLVDTHGELKSAWQAIIRRGAKPEEIAALATVPVTGQAALELAKGDWQKSAFRNAKQIEWQSWAQTKYRRLAAGEDRGQRAEGGDQRSESRK